MKIRGKWVYLYRAVDSTGQTVDFRLSGKRDVGATKAFFRKAMKTQGSAPRTITLDGYAASHRAVREMKTDGQLPPDTKVRSSKYLNNLIEQDHRHIKSRTNVMLSFNRFRSRDHDFRHRVGASHSQGSVRSLEARPQGCRCEDIHKNPWQMGLSLPCS